MSKAIKQKKLVYGVGINDASYKVTKIIDGRQVMCPLYMRWKNMMLRSYSDSFHRNNPKYKDCTVCKKWHSFMNFREWILKQDYVGKCLDKDILYPNNKVYSPATCCFVSNAINTFFTGNSTISGKYKRGVSLDKDRGNFQMSIHTKKGRIRGRYDTEEEASQAYLVAKVDHIRSLFNEVDERIKEGLEKHILLISCPICSHS